MRKGFAPTSVGQVHYLEDGDGPPLVLIHRTPDSALLFAHVQPLLAKRFRVVAIDSPGFGESAAPEAQPRIEDFAGWAVEVMDALGIGRAHLLGHRTGSAIAAEIAATMPERVNRVVLSGTADFTPEEKAGGPQFRGGRDLKPDGHHITGLWERTRDLMGDWVSPEELNRCVLDVSRNAPEATLYAETAVYGQDLHARLRRIAAPVLVLYGENDPFVRRLPGLVASLPDGRSAIIAVATQFTMLQFPDVFARIAGDFLAG